MEPSQPTRRQGAGVLVSISATRAMLVSTNFSELNADRHRFHELGAEVIAISGDQSELTQQQFEKYGAFGFPVLSDSDHQVAESYGVLRPATALQPAKLLHASFIIRRAPQVHWVRYGDTPFRFNMALLYEVARLENKLPLSGPSGPRQKSRRSNRNEIALLVLRRC